MIRVPRRDELERLRAIEVAAGALFAGIGMDDIAAHEPASTDELDRYRIDGRAFCCEVDGVVAGYALVDVVDGAGHLEQLSVDPAFGRRGLGRALVEHVCAWARRSGFDSVTLTTFRDVPWNAPYYARLGFVVLEADGLGPELRRLVAEEAAHGLDPAARVCMHRPLSEL